jgi:hypothetical protein
MTRSKLGVEVGSGDGEGPGEHLEPVGPFSDGQVDERAADLRFFYDPV